jgi:hypothetical protein
MIIPCFTSCSQSCRSHISAIRQPTCPASSPTATDLAPRLLLLVHTETTAASYHRFVRYYPSSKSKLKSRLQFSIVNSSTAPPHRITHFVRSQMQDFLVAGLPIYLRDYLPMGPRTTTTTPICSSPYYSARPSTRQAPWLSRSQAQGKCKPDVYG